MTEPTPSPNDSPATESVDQPPRLLVRLFGSLALLGVSGLLALGVAEVAVRLAAPQQLILIRPDVWEPVDTLGWVRRPNIETQMNTGERTVTVRTDSARFRVGATGRREAATQVLLLGDSFMEALQVEYEQSTAGLLEAGLEAASGRPVAVRNAGVSGWSPNQYRLLARRELAETSYALIVVAVFVGNDVIGEATERIPPRVPVERKHFRFPRSLAARELIDALAAPVNDVLEVRSHLFILAKNSLATMRMRLGLTADYFPRWYQKAEADSPAWGVTVAVLRALADEAQAKGTPTVFVLVPERLQVHSDEFLRYLKGFDIDPASVDLDQPSRVLREGLEAAGLRVVDALGPFRAAAAETRLHGVVDQHLSPEGHRVLTDVILPVAAPLLAR
ncbi:MAG: SGNH/GDSL hydrolase family protein [Gemmatimonadaceae bacterium]|nr:SGNH/GDSL hydrolase family protein [Gemmatimonadaceae bacterium]